MAHGILADVNITKHFKILVVLFNADSRRELWESLQLRCPTFGEVGLDLYSSDLVVWQKCQENELVLITANRNDDGPEALETTIRTLSSPISLPVMTLANADRVLQNKSYAARVADRILELLFDIDQYLGVGRLYVP